MKKSLIALAVLGFAGGAMAQSSVTLYGIANAGIGGSTQSQASVAGVAIPGATGIVARNKANVMDSPNGTPSRFGLRGTEDLGGGMSASFNIESGLNLGTGAAEAVFWQRTAWLGLGGGFGTVRLGRQYTVALDGSSWSMPATRTSAQLLAGLGFNGMGARNDNVIKYISPNFSGFTVEASYQLKGNGTNAAGTAGGYAYAPQLPANVNSALVAGWLAGQQHAYNVNGTMELGVLYGNGPLKANLTLSKVRDWSTAFGLNAAYDFGGFQVLGGYSKAPSKSWTGVYTNGFARGFWIGANATVGAFKPWIQLARNTKAKATAWELGMDYALSKRTKLYAVYGRVGTSHLTVPGPVTTDFSGLSRWGFGMQHSF